MTDYQEYIGSLRKCAKEHENDRTSTGQIIVSNLCEVIADLLEELSGSENLNKSEIPTGSDDCISRAEAQTEIEMNASRYTIAKERCGMGQVEWSDQLIKVSDAVDIIRKLPSVTPIRPKGHWVMTHDYLTTAYGYIDYVKCSCCGEDSLEEQNYCPNCGAKMEEVRE